MKVALIAAIVILAAAGTSAQEWTKAQSEVWQVVTSAWNSYKTGDIDLVAATIHPKYQGWDNLTPLPYNKEKSMQQTREWLVINKLEFYDIEPARITVLENVAVVDYYYDYILITTAGEKKESKERKGMAVEFYVKEGGKWLLLGDMTTRQ